MYIEVQNTNKDPYKSWLWWFGSFVCQGQTITIMKCLALHFTRLHLLMIYYDPMTGAILQKVFELWKHILYIFEENSFLSFYYYNLWNI